MRKHIAWLSVLLLMLAFGCGRRAPQRRPAPAPAPKTSVPLPEWAPKDPSPEFLRAAQVLKPLPAELWLKTPGASLADRAMRTHISQTYLAAWEVFGSLTEEQVQRFLTSRPARTSNEPDAVSKRLVIPITSLTPKQRAALDEYFEVWRNTMQGIPPEEVHGPGPDRLVTMYRYGAKEDLSNVDVGFNQAGHSVNIFFRIHQPSGETISGFGCTIATI